MLNYWTLACAGVTESELLEVPLEHFMSWHCSTYYRFSNFFLLFRLSDLRVLSGEQISSETLKCIKIIF